MRQASHGDDGTHGGKRIDRFDRKWGFLALLCGIPFFLAFALLGDPGRGRAAAVSAVVIVIVAKARSDLVHHVWFWATLACLSILHVPLVLLVPWDDKSYPAATLLPIAFADYALAYGCIKLVERAFEDADP